MSVISTFVRVLYEHGTTRARIAALLAEEGPKSLPFASTASIIVGYENVDMDKVFELLDSLDLDRRRYLNIAVNWTPPKAEQRPDKEEVWVYVFAVDHPGDTLVKVGISKQVDYRLATLEKERGLNLYLAHQEGPFTRAKALDIERAAHESLADWRERGEWFECGAELALRTVKAHAEDARQ